MKRRTGQGLVEFALVLPVLLLIILGIVEAAFLIQGYLTVQHAAREAARFAVTYQPIRGYKLSGDICDYEVSQGPLFSDPAEICNKYEDDDEYHARRVALIKREARRAAAGLRIGPLGLDEDSFHLYKDEPGFFGVRVWGFPSFDADCNADPDSCIDHPGIEGTPVRVLVLHNVEIIDPFYRAVVEHVPVQADTQMINEGIQAGMSDQVPPGFETGGYIEETAPPTSTREPTPTPTHTPTPTQTVTPSSTPTTTVTSTPLPLYSVVLSEDATNDLPDDRHHEFIATVTDQLERPVEGESVSFSTDEGGFSYSGVGSEYAGAQTDAGGQAVVTLYGNRPGTATVRAWLDYNGNGRRDGGEPSDTATKTWNVSGPYITISDHDVIPQQSINAGVMDHDPVDNPYHLLWCLVSGAASVTQTTVASGVSVDSVTWDKTNVAFDVPRGSEGLYRVESHSDGGGCGSAGVAAYSAAIHVPEIDPDDFASIHGEAWVLAGGIPWVFPGVNLWAYGPDGEVYHTSTGEGGAYEFLHLPPGTYRIYAEIWVGGWLRFATRTVQVSEGDHTVNLFLL